MTVEPMTDAELRDVRHCLARSVPPLLSEAERLVARIDAAESTISTLTAERDAAVAREAEREADADGWFLRAMAAIGKLPAETLRGDLQAAYAEAEARLLPKPRLVRTVEEVGALTIGAYRIAPPWRTRQWILGRRHPPGTWTLLIDTGASDVKDDHIVGSWVQRLPDLPTPTAAQEC